MNPFQDAQQVIDTSQVWALLDSILQYLHAEDEL